MLCLAAEARTQHITFYDRIYYLKVGYRQKVKSCCHRSRQPKAPSYIYITCSYGVIPQSQHATTCTISTLCKIAAYQPPFAHATATALRPLFVYAQSPHKRLSILKPKNRIKLNEFIMSLSYYGSSSLKRLP